MKINNSFNVGIPISDAWHLLTDIESIVPCMPGAELTEIVDETTFHGNVSVRLGPVSLKFSGTARFEEMDEQNYCAKVHAKGSDEKGRGGATADIIFQLESREQKTFVVIETDLALSGSVAQYGRGAGMINELASQLVGQFSTSLHNKITEENAMASNKSDGSEVPNKLDSIKPISGVSLMLKVGIAILTRFFRKIFKRQHSM